MGSTSLLGSSSEAMKASNCKRTHLHHLDLLRSVVSGTTTKLLNTDLTRQMGKTAQSEDTRSSSVECLSFLSCNGGDILCSACVIGSMRPNLNDSRFCFLTRLVSSDRVGRHVSLLLQHTTSHCPLCFDEACKGASEVGVPTHGSLSPSYLCIDLCPEKTGQQRGSVRFYTGDHPHPPFPRKGSEGMAESRD